MRRSKAGSRFCVRFVVAMRMPSASLKRRMGARGERSTKESTSSATAIARFFIERFPQRRVTQKPLTRFPPSGFPLKILKMKLPPVNAFIFNTVNHLNRFLEGSALPTQILQSRRIIVIEWRIATADVTNAVQVFIYILNVGHMQTLINLTEWPSVPC